MKPTKETQSSTVGQHRALAVPKYLSESGHSRTAVSSRRDLKNPAVAQGVQECHWLIVVALTRRFRRLIICNPQMEVGLHANMCDSTTERIASALHSPFKEIGKDLSRDYGGTMNHLWIDFELIERRAGRRPPWSFRFQRRVGGSSLDKLTGLPRGAYENVGHYSVEPDFNKLLRVPLDSVVSHVLSLIYASTSVLVEKQKKLGGFDAQTFRSDFLTICLRHGYSIDSTI